MRVEPPLDLQPQIVVVEDEAPILELIREVLELEGYTSAAVRHPYRLDVRQSRPALFLIDMMLPDGNGIEVAEHLRRSGHAGTPSIAMSGSRAMLVRAAASGLFDDTLSKPFDVVHLLELVAHYVDQIDMHLDRVALVPRGDECCTFCGRLILSPAGAVLVPDHPGTVEWWHMDCRDKVIPLLLGEGDTDTEATA